MKKSSINKNKEKAKSFSFFTRITTLLIVAAAIIVSTVFSVFYLDKNSNLSIEFAGGYQTQVKYEGIYEENSQTQEIINLLENRVDPLGTSNIGVEKSSRTGNYYNLSISKSAGIDLPIFINNVSRRGYVYLLDGQGHDLLANKYDKDNNTWSAREERITTSEAFSSITSKTNSNSGQPEVVFTVQNQELLETIQSILQATGGSDGIYFYSDIGQLLNYVRNTLTGLQELVRFIDESNSNEAPALKALLANHVPGLGDDSGDRMYNAIKRPNTTEGKVLTNLLNQSKNGVYTIDWKYSDASESTPLSVDTNNKDNGFDPNKPFDPESTPTKGTNSPLNAWLAHIKDLIILPDISAALNTAIINYKYAPYYIGGIGVTNITNNMLTINDDTFNKEKVQQISNVLNAGRDKNNFSVLSVLIVEPTLGAQALKVAMIGMLVALVFLSVAILLNYRMLGLTAVLIIILFLVATLVTFTFLNNVVAPETGIALIIGFALLLDTIVGLFNRIQKEYQSGKSVFDAFKAANKKSLVSAVDCSIIVLLVSLTIFWFGARSIRGFAIMTSISSFGVILIGVFLLRLILYFLLKNNSFEKRPDLLALKHNIIPSQPQGELVDPIAPVATKKTKKQKDYKIKKKVNQSKAKFALMKESFVKRMSSDKKNSFLHISQWNFWHKATKWVMVASGVILVLSGIVYLAAGSNFGPGFDSRIDFTGEASSSSGNLDELDLWKEAEEYKAEVIVQLDANHKSYQKVYTSLNLDSIGTSSNTIKIIIQTNIKDEDTLAYLQFLHDNILSMSWSSEQNDALSGNELFKEMLIVIAISLIMIFIYVVIRFQLTFAVPLLVALVFAVFTSLALVSLLQITISTMTIGVLLALVVLVLINSVVIFDNIKEIKLNNNEKRNSLEKNEILAISNEGIKKSLSRTLSLNGIIIFTALIVLFFLPSFWAVSLALILGTIVTFVATHFVGPWMWTFFERWRIKRYKKRIEKIKKNFAGPDEYIIEGIND